MDRFVRDDKGNTFVLSSQLGEGGQGVVYRVNRNTGHGLAIKALLDPVSGNILQDHGEYKKYMRKLNRIMALPQIAHLAIPLAPLHAPYCGYVMRLMEGMEPLGEYLKPNSDIKKTLSQKGGLSKRLKLLKNLSAVLCDLHTRGIVYADLAPGNIFVSTNDRDSEVWLIDLDNLAYANETTSSIGTPFYRAPEIARGKQNSIQSDCYSFALIAFECLTFSKPFNGSIMDEEPTDDFSDDLFERIESGDCQYVHEIGTNNLPKYGISKNLELVMTPEIKELFLQTFNSDGRVHPNCRPSMRTWLRAFEDACNNLVDCENGHAHFGNDCFLCSDADRKSSCLRHYTLKGYLTIRALQSPECSEDCDSFEQFKAKCLIYKKRFNNKKIGRNADGISIPISWRILDSRSKRARDSVAFEISLKKLGCNIEKVFNPELRVTLVQNATWPDMADLRIHVAYRDNEFEFEMTKDE